MMPRRNIAAHIIQPNTISILSNALRAYRAGGVPWETVLDVRMWGE